MIAANPLVPQLTAGFFHADAVEVAMRQGQVLKSEPAVPGRVGGMANTLGLA